MSAPGGRESPAEVTRLETPQSIPPTAGSPEPPHDPGNLTGRFGRYEIVRLLGRGGMGAVYLAKQTDLDRLVVVKVILGASDGEAVLRFQREAKAAARISSDNVVQVYETGVEQGTAFIAMEYVEGSSAADLLKKRGRLGWQEATQLIVAAAKGLGAAHEMGILHRDVKPANLLVAKDGRVKVADFGLAKPTSREAEQRAPELTTAGMVLGTPHYMAPEQAEAKPLDARADLYALGVTYYELLTGRRPFDGDSVLKVLNQVLNGPTPSPRAVVPDLPASVERACQRLMARDREKRPASAGEAVQLLERIIQLTASGRAPALAHEPAPRTGSQRSPSIAVKKKPETASALPLVLVVLLAAATIGGVFWVRAKKAPAPPPSAPARPVATEERRAPGDPRPVTPDKGFEKVEIVPPSPAPPPPPRAVPPPPRGTIETPDELLRTVSRDANDGQYARVIELTDAALVRLGPDDHEDAVKFLLFRAVAHMLLGEYAQGEADLGKVKELDSKKPGFLVFISFCGALLAHDGALARERKRQIDALRVTNLPYKETSSELARAAADKVRPDRKSNPFPSTVDVLNVIYWKTIDHFAPKKK